MPFPIEPTGRIRSSRGIARNLKIASALTILLPAQALAQEQESSTTSEWLNGLEQCRDILAAESRLACFDEEVAEILKATEAGEVQIVDGEDLRKTRRGLFGFSLPKSGIFGGGADELERKMQSEITSLRRIDSDSWVITIAEGSVWRVENAHRGFKPRVGAPVELERAAMGSYWVRVDGQIGAKGRRID